MAISTSSFSFRSLGALLALGFVLSPAAACVSGSIGGPDDDASDEDVHAAGMTFDEFMDVVYQEPDTGIYIANGDTPFETIRELKQFYYDHVQQGQLIVHQSGGVDAKWSDTQKLNLTYCIQKSSFTTSQYNTVVSAMNSASGAWEGVANINFVHSTSYDTNCTKSQNGVVFNVRKVNSGGQYLARAFFPNQSRSTRELLIDSSALGNISPWSLTGVLRHELGHALGFRHEHTRPESGTCFEDNNWRALTTYDSASVMHYPQCNGSQTGDLVITSKDSQGAASLYGAPGGGGGTPPPTCAHDKCVTGVALDASACGTVVAAVCAADSYCCNTSWDSVCVNEVATIGNSASCTGSCAHSPCTTGTKLVSGCDAGGVVSAVCAADSYCCNNSWDSICVGEVASVAGKTCN